MFKKLYLPILFLMCLSAYSFAQTQQIASVYHDVHKIESKFVNETRTIWVRVPLNYQRTKEKFPVVYMLDGHAPHPSMMAGIIEQQAWGGQMPEMILVSIQNTNRSKDLTPTDDGQGGQVGGGIKFLDFLEKEIIPLVEKNYRTEPYRIFAGHSLGGLTVVYSMATRPELFNAYIAASPVLHFDDFVAIKETEKLFENNKELDKTIFLGLGDEPQYEKGWNRFQKLLKDKKPKNFEYEFQDFKEDNHGSVVLPVYYQGLRKIFAGWIPKNIATIADLENHYKKLSKRFGFEIKIPEEMLNRAAYGLLRQKKYPEAIKYFEKNAENYPDSPNTYDSLGDALEKNGQLKKALENYEKAFQIATRQNDFRASIYQQNLERVAEKLK
jgi:predicted alpha/beta superfamily hydrolase